MSYNNENKIFTSKKAPSELLPARDSEGHKGTFGKVLLIVGSRNMAGAAILAAKAAYRTGAGMVKVISPECNRQIIQIAVPEALYMPSEAPEEEWTRSFEWCDCIGIGSGLGTDDDAKKSLKRTLEMSDKPLLIDADGLNIISGTKEHDYWVKWIADTSRSIVFTPHYGELARLVQSLPCAKEPDMVGNGDRQLKLLSSAILVSEYYGSVVAAKSADTYVVDAKERYSDGKIFLNDRGNSGMATAGSGDVLAGCITALMGQGMNPFEAACNGVQLHAVAGDRAVRGHSQAWIMAGDICENLGLDII